MYVHWTWHCVTKDTLIQVYMLYLGVLSSPLHFWFIPFISLPWMVALLLSCHMYIYVHFLFNYNKICVPLNACNSSTPEVLCRRTMVRSSRSSLRYMIFGFSNDNNNHFHDLTVHWLNGIKYTYIATITTHFQSRLCLLKYNSLCCAPPPAPGDYHLSACEMYLL